MRADDKTSWWDSTAHRLRVRRRITIVLVVALVACGLAMGLPVVLSPPRSVVLAPVSSREPAMKTNLATPGPNLSLMVHLVGAVVRPGLIAVNTGSRVIDAVLLAGGLASNADQCGVNLARLVTDGEQIVIPIAAVSGAPCSVSAGASSGKPVAGEKISLSRATQEQLDSLPGVGPALAARIIDWRSAHGGFSSVSQLDQVSGIGVKLLAGLKPLVVP